VRTSVPPMSLVGAVKAAVTDVDRSTPAAEIRTAEETIQNGARNLRLYMFLLTVFGAAAILLASTGIYGIISYSIAERRREIGIRMTLGAGAHVVLTMIFRQAALIIGPGLVFGLAGSLGLSRLLQSAVAGITPADAPIYVAVCVLLIFTAMLACFIPTRRAISIDPTESLKL
jgi:ABC-type antimicrobial peptide transport system permease subunit